MRWHKDRHEKLPPELVIGAPIQGTEPSVATIDGGQKSGCDDLLIEDQYFDPNVFLAWGQVVYDGVVAAWRTHTPAEMRPVMTPPVRDIYSQHLLALSALPQTRSVMGAVSVAPTMVGGDIGGGHHSVVIEFELVVVDEEVCRLWDLRTDQRRWSERWLFQRPQATKTIAAEAIDRCITCGAPVRPVLQDRCDHCDSDITGRTGGWQVTRVQTTMPEMREIDDRLAGMRARFSSS